MTSTGIDEDNPMSYGQKFSAHIIKTTSIKKKNRLGLFYKRILNLTDEPKLFYFRENKEKEKKAHKTKYLNLHPDITRLERLDQTKFKVSDYTAKKPNV